MECCIAAHNSSKAGVQAKTGRRETRDDRFYFQQKSSWHKHRLRERTQDAAELIKRRLVFHAALFRNRWLLPQITGDFVA
jgi:hypothetical protein